jgi:hypothetical protein
MFGRIALKNNSKNWVKSLVVPLHGRYGSWPQYCVGEIWKTILMSAGHYEG